MDEWISKYIRYHRYWMNEYLNIFGMIKRSWMNIQINLILKKLTTIFLNEYICPKYTNIFKYLVIYTRWFWTILAIFIFCVIFDPYKNYFGPILTIFNQFWENWTNIYPNTFVSINKPQMNIGIYLPWKKSMSLPYGYTVKYSS